MSNYGTCNAQYGAHRCGAIAATWVEVQLPMGSSQFLQRYRAFVCPDHVVALKAKGARVTRLDALAASA